MADDEYSGSLKQQCPTSSGLYDWVRRFFRLSLQNGVLEALSGEQQQQHQDGGAVERGGDVSLSLENAKYAKEWSLSDMIAGFGFDIVWKDANITSFLASDAASCSKWVEHINAAINIHAQNVSDDYESVFAGGGGVNGGVGGGGGVGGDVGFEGNVPPLAARPPLHPPKLTASAENWHAGLGASVGTGGVLATMAEGADSTRLDPSSPVHHHQRNGNNNNNNNNMSADTIKRYSPGGGAGAGGGGARGSGIDEWSQSLSHSQVFALQQQQQQRERIGSFASNSDDGIGGGGGRGGGGTGIGEEGGGRIAVGGGGGGELGESLLGAELEREGNMAQVMLLQQRCQRLAQKAEREAADALLCREMMMKVQAELDARKGQYQREMESIQREREQAMQLQQSELEIRLLRVSNENTAFHDAALRAEREQSQREMACLREELAAERKRYSSLLQNESSLRDKAEGKEVSLVTEIARLKEQTQRAINEATRVKEVHAADVSAFEREKKIMITDLEARTARLEREREVRRKATCFFKALVYSTRSILSTHTHTHVTSPLLHNNTGVEHQEPSRNEKEDKRACSTIRSQGVFPALILQSPSMCDHTQLHMLTTTHSRTNNKLNNNTHIRSRKWRRAFPITRNTNSKACICEVCIYAYKF